MRRLDLANLLRFMDWFYIHRSGCKTGPDVNPPVSRSSFHVQNKFDWFIGWFESGSTIHSWMLCLVIYITVRIWSQRSYIWVTWPRHHSNSAVVIAEDILPSAKKAVSHWANLDCWGNFWLRELGLWPFGLKMRFGTRCWEKWMTWVQLAALRNLSRCCWLADTVG